MSTERNTEAITIVKSQPFSKQSPDLWFILLEAQFAARKITADRTKYNMTLANISTDIAMQVQSIITTEYEEGKYETLKKALIKAYSISNTEKFLKLVSKEELGGQKPSHLLQRLHALADQDVGDEFIKKLWLQRLPNTTRIILSTSSDTIDKLAIMADTILENSDNFSTVAVQSNENHSSVSKVLENITNELEKLNARINTVETGHISRSDGRYSSHRSRPQSRYRSKGRSTSSNNDNQGQNNSEICWYHETHKHKAKKCRPPCKMSENQKN